MLLSAILVFFESVIDAKELYYPDFNDRLERLVYSEVSYGDAVRMEQWQSDLNAVPNVNERLVELVERDYLKAKNGSQLSDSMSALCQRSNLTSDQLRRITCHFQSLKSPDLSRNPLDDQLVSGGLRLLAKYPSPEDEQLALRFLEDQHPGVILNAVHCLSEIGGHETIVKVDEMVADRRNKTEHGSVCDGS